MNAPLVVTQSGEVTRLGWRQKRVCNVQLEAKTLALDFSPGSVHVRSGEGGEMWRQKASLFNHKPLPDLIFYFACSLIPMYLKVEAVYPKINV